MSRQRLCQQTDQLHLELVLGLEQFHQTELHAEYSEQMRAGSGIPDHPATTGNLRVSPGEHERHHQRGLV